MPVVAQEFLFGVLWRSRVQGRIPGRESGVKQFADYYYFMFVGLFYVLSFHLSMIMLVLGQLSVLVLAVQLTGYLYVHVLLLVYPVSK